MFAWDAIQLEAARVRTKVDLGILGVFTREAKRSKDGSKETSQSIILDKDFWAQFHPREFSAITGAEMAPRGVPPLPPLPRLLRPCTDGPGVCLPPDIIALAPPMSAGLPDWYISAGF